MSSQLTFSPSFFRGVGEKTTKQFRYHGPLIVDIPSKDSDFPVEPAILMGKSTIFQQFPTISTRD